MADCKRLEKCPFFNDRMAARPATAELFKIEYCRSEPERCARYRVAEVLGPERVPGDLFPSQVERVDELLGLNKPS